MQFPKRLIEVDLPIKRISAHARREKSIRHGHISTLHIWWARRPLAACRAVICAALWPDPADQHCPAEFRTAAAEIILKFARQTAQDKDLAGHCSEETWNRWMGLTKSGHGFDLETDAGRLQLRVALLDFIADFANWDSSTVPEYLETSRALTQAAHEALGGAPGTRPLVVDSFAGGGSIPLEAMRVGADAFASDLNPVAVLLNKVVLEYIPKYGQRLADEVRKWGAWIKQEAEKELAEFYPKDPDGATPIAYLWARTIQCEGPGCGAEVPLIRSLWLAKKTNRSLALQLIPSSVTKRVEFQIIVKGPDGWIDQSNPKSKVEKPKFDGTVKRGAATCPCCGYTTPVTCVREQLSRRKGGTNDARLICVITTKLNEQGRNYRLCGDKDFLSVSKAEQRLKHILANDKIGMSALPFEEVNKDHHDVNRLPLYGMNRWADAFTNRQLVALNRFIETLKHGLEISNFSKESALLFALAIDRLADYGSSVCRWVPRGEYMGNSFGRQALQMVWDFAEVNPFSGSTGDFSGALDWIAQVVEREAQSLSCAGSAEPVNATCHSLPDDVANAFVTDPPYFDAIDYGVISDFFYSWLKRSLAGSFPDLLVCSETPKDDQIVVNANTTKGTGTRDEKFFKLAMMKAMAEGRRITKPDGIGVIVFAHKSTAGWESQLTGMLDAGWTITASWPIDTEMSERLVARGSAALASSVHLVCRPRENPDGSIRTDDVGDWRDVLAELPHRIHDWMPRLAEEGVVGADAIFACLGPALEIFSRYSCVEKASGESVTLKEYLEQVWAAVSREALSMIFEDAEGAGLEEDSRLTAMWLWTLSTGGNRNGAGNGEEEAPEEEEGETTDKVSSTGGFTLEFDAARKIAQGLGIHMDQLKNMVEIKGDVARLLPVSERAGYLFGQETTLSKQKRKQKQSQLSLFELQDDYTVEGAMELPPVSNLGETVLDRVHQSMLLFAGGRSEALKRFLVEDGVGRDTRYWKLAQALSALYPPGSDEKRWVDGVLARKKGLGF